MTSSLNLKIKPYLFSYGLPDDTNIYSCPDSKCDQIDKVKLASDLRNDQPSFANWIKE